MSIRKAMKDAEHPYVMVSKRWVNDLAISPKTKGMMLYILSKPDTWRIRERELMKSLGIGRDAVRTGLAEMEKAGYLRVMKVHGKKGRFGSNDYELTEDSTVSGYPTRETRHLVSNEYNK